MWIGFDLQYAGIHLESDRENSCRSTKRETLRATGRIPRRSTYSRTDKANTLRAVGSSAKAGTRKGQEIMPTARHTALILLFAFASLPDSTAFAGMVLMSGAHRAVVWDPDEGESDRHSDITQGVPFEGTASANHRMLTADIVFSTFFDANLLSSSFESIHSVLQTTQKPPDELFSATGSTFWFTTDMDVEVSVHGSMSFNLGVVDSSTAIVLDIFDGNQDRIYRSVQESRIGTGDGMLLFDDSILLDGGGMYFVEVNTNLIAFAHRNPGPVSTASGEIAVVIATVPEPTSLALLCYGALLARLRGGKVPSFSGGSTRHDP